MPRRSAQTLGRRHNEVVDILNKQKRNEYSYKELATVFWNLGECVLECVVTPKPVVSCLLNPNFLYFRHLYIVIQRTMYEDC